MRYRLDFGDKVSCKCTTGLLVRSESCIIRNDAQQHRHRFVKLTHGFVSVIHGKRERKLTELLTRTVCDTQRSKTRSRWCRLISVGRSTLCKGITTNQVKRNMNMQRLDRSRNGKGSLSLT